tara:strand:+ start:201 stop:548 length:348 start_codon:yes stop_codon:yes gene_type:complete
MAIGKMVHSVKLQQPSRSTDTGGGAVITFSDVATVFASIKPKGGSEVLFGDQLEGRETYVITIRFRRGVTNKFRILYAFTTGGANFTRTFNITRVENVNERDRYLNLYCTEGVAV